MANDTDEHDDFIVVHDGLPRIGPHGENLAAAPETSSNSPAKSPESTERVRRTTRPSSQRRSDGGFNDTLDPLRALPEVRAIPWYEGKELPTEKSTESPRVQTRGACLLASRGEIQDPPCNHCASGVGRFSQCIALDDWFHGACATCQLATRGNLCSLRTNKEVAVKSENEQHESPAAEMPAASKTSKRKQPESSSTPTTRRPRKSAPTASQPAPPMGNNSFQRPQDATRPADEYISQFGQPSQSLKRKRETLQGTSVYRPYVSPYAPLDPPNRLASSLPNTPIVASTPNMIIPANIARDQSAYNNFIQQRQNQQNGAAQQSKQAPSVPTFSAVNGSGYRNSPTIIQTGRNLNESREVDRDATESMSPSTQLLNQPLQSPTPEPLSSRTQPEPTRMTTRNSQKKTIRANGTTAQPNSSRALDPPDTPLIDTLPRRKQKQIYGIIGGLQSGIRSCQQQAENMQKQLDLLQAALGIDLDDDKDMSKP